MKLESSRELPHPEKRRGAGALGVDSGEREGRKRRRQAAWRERASARVGGGSRWACSNTPLLEAPVRLCTPPRPSFSFSASSSSSGFGAG